MKKLFPLILSITLGVLGFLYFNRDNISIFKVNRVNIYHYQEYKDNPKDTSPFISIDEKNLVNIIASTINSSQKIEDTLDIDNPNYLIDIVYSKDNKDTFYLWINEDSQSGIYMNTSATNTGYALCKKDTNKLKTLLFR